MSILHDIKGLKLKDITLAHDQNPLVFLDLKIGRDQVGRVIIELFQHAVPSTAENFRALCTGEFGMCELGKPLHFKGSTFHKIIPHFMFQGGDIINLDGTSGYSIYGSEFELENFTVLHDQPGMLSTVNTRETYCNSQFIITSTECPHLNGRSVAFGRVIRGFSCVLEMGAVKTHNDVPQDRCEIEDCGQINSLEEAFSDQAFNSDDGLPHSPTDLELIDNLLKVDDLKSIIEVIITSAKVHFQKRDFIRSHHRFRKAIRYIEWLQKESNQSECLTHGEKIDLSNYLLSQINKSYLNLSGTSLELEDTSKCEYYCDLVLANESSNVKALYRKGKALYMAKDYERALSTLKNAQTLQPSDPLITKAIQEIRGKRAEYLEQEKRIFSKMFSK